MKHSVSAVAICLLVAACGASGSTSAPSPVPTAEALPATTSAAPVSATAPPVTVTTSPATATASPSDVLASPTGDTFALCPTANDAATCPLPPGVYRAAIHDAYTLTIKAGGWQEERTAAEEEPTVTLSRTDGRDHRVSIDTGDTGSLLDDAGMAALLADTTTFQISAPVAVRVGTADAILGVASGYQVDLAPTETRQVTVSGAGTYTFKAGHRYRLMALQLPMLEESGIKVIIVDAPTASFDSFLPLANAVLQGLHFENAS